IDAMALVVELPKSPDPLEAAKAHALEHIKRSYGKDVPAGLRLEELTKSRSGVALPTGGPPIGRFRVEPPGDRSNPDLWVISVIEVGDKIVAVEAHVAGKDASYVEEWVGHLAGSLKAKGNNGSSSIFVRTGPAGGSCGPRASGPGGGARPPPGRVARGPGAPAGCVRGVQVVYRSFPLQPPGQGARVPGEKHLPARPRKKPC